MPKLSDTMTEGVVAEWHKKIGDKVKSGDLLAEIETDKATMEFESFQDGYLLYIGVEKGQSAPVDSILAIIGEKGEDYSSLLKSGGKQAPASEAKTAEAPAKQNGVSQEHSKPAEAVASTVSSQGPDGGRIKASPLARKLAKEKGIELTALTGSGDGGRIVRRDIEEAQAQPAAASTSTAVAGKVDFREEPVSQMRKTIARRLSESMFTAPHFYLTMEIEMDAAMNARKSILDSLGVKISFNDLVIKAVAAALKKHPKVNSSWLGDKIRYNSHVNIGVAVAVEEGLLVPVIRFADTKTLSQISEEVKTFAQKAKDKKLQPSDWEGNTFTISNLGMFGIDEFTAIINPPDACILAVGGIKETVLVKNGQMKPGNVMKVTLSCDHRVVDGATGAAFLQTFKQMLENPVLMIGV